MRIRCSQQIRGFPIATIEEQISLYADDTLVYLTDTQDLLKTLLLEMDNFGDYSGFQVNWDKSNLFPLDPDATVQIHPDSRLQVVSSFRYLGVIVQLPLSSYIENNLFPLLTQVQLQTKQWMDLPLDLMRRANTLKMIPKAIFKWIDIICMAFLWNCRSPSAALETLRLPAHLAGLVFPNFYLYYLASQLVHIRDWLHPAVANACTSTDGAIASLIETIISYTEARLQPAQVHLC